MTEILFARKDDVDAVSAAASAAAASASAVSASTSETNAASSASSASTSASNASTSASAASSSATAAAASATSSAQAAAVNEQVMWTYDSSGSTTTSSAPSDEGGARFNALSFSDVTQLSVDANSAVTDNPDISGFVASWDDVANVNGGSILTLTKKTAPQNFGLYYVTGVTDNGSWLQINVTLIGSAANGTVAASDDILARVAQSGADGGGDMSASTYDPASVAEQLVGLTATQTLTNKTLTSPVLDLPQINDTSDDHQYIFGVSELAADRTVTLPLLTGNDTFVFQAHNQTLTNKTIDHANNTLTLPTADNTTQGIIELATDAETQTGTDTARAITPAGLQSKTASATAIGLVELATDAETQTGTDTGRAITPANLTAKEATAAQFRDNTSDRILTTDQVWSGASLVTLTDAGTIAVNMSSGINFQVTLGGNRTLGNPTNVKAGQSGLIIVNQDGTGSRTLAYGANWEFPSGVAPTLTTTASAKDILTYFAQTGTSIIVTGVLRDVS